VENKDNKQNNKVLVHGQGQANKDGVKDNAEFQDCDADWLSVGGIRAGVGDRGSDLPITFLVVNVMMTARGVALCKAGWASLA